LFEKVRNFPSYTVDEDFSHSEERRAILAVLGLNLLGVSRKGELEVEFLILKSKTATKNKLRIKIEKSLLQYKQSEQSLTVLRFFS